MKEGAQSVEMGNECRPRGPFSAHDEQGGEAGSSSKKSETSLVRVPVLPTTGPFVCPP